MSTFGSQGKIKSWSGFRYPADQILRDLSPELINLLMVFVTLGISLDLGEISGAQRSHFSLWVISGRGGKCPEQRGRLIEHTIDVCDRFRETTPEYEYSNLIPLDNHSTKLVAERRSEIFRPQSFLIVNRSPESVIEEIAFFGSAQGPRHFLTTLLRGH